MIRMARRVSIAPRLERLEARELLSASSDSWLIRDPNPAAGLLVRFRAGIAPATQQAILTQSKTQLLVTYPDGTSLVEAASAAARPAAINRLNAFRGVIYVEPDGPVQVQDVTVNDPAVAQQWALNSPNNVDIDAPQAWSITTGNPNTIVAVIDSGIDLNHPEFAGRIWTNPDANAPNDATPGDVHGWNFITNTPDVQDDNGHGTHVAGIIAATGNNAAGVAGVNWQAQIMPLKFIAANGAGAVSDAIRAVDYAVDHGAKVINASWGGGSHVQALTDAIAYAGAHNVVFVTAAGNEGKNNAQVKSYPADDRLSNTLCVAAIDQTGKLARFSNFGNTTVDLAAPGVNILSTYLGGYATETGTSMASPYVAGVVSLVAGHSSRLHRRATRATDRQHGKNDAQTQGQSDHRRHGRCRQRRERSVYRPPSRSFRAGSSYRPDSPNCPSPGLTIKTKPGPTQAVSVPVCSDLQTRLLRIDRTMTRAISAKPYRFAGGGTS